MITPNTLKRGFKAQAERMAEDYRAQLKLEPHAPLCAFKLAEHLQIAVFTPADFSMTDQEIEVLCNADSGWSALTQRTTTGNKIIIHNHFHSSARQQSNIMHELSHIICGHQHNQHDVVLPRGMREFDREKENEANCLGATLQITRKGLLWAVQKMRMTVDQMAEYYNASKEMVSFRINTTGVMRQVGSRKGFGRK